MLFRSGYSFAIIRAALEENEEQKEADDDDTDALTYQGEKLHAKYVKLPKKEYRQKMKMALYRKGFPMDMISDFIAEKENEE